MFQIKKIKKVNAYFASQIIDLERKVAFLGASLQAKTDQIDFIKDLLDQGYKIESIAENRDNVTVYICSFDRQDLSIFMKTKGFNDNYGELVIDSKKTEHSIAAAAKGTESKTVHVFNLAVNDKHIGNGSLLLKHFFKIAKEEGFKKVEGELAPIDKAHFDDLERLYTKLECVVTFNEDRRFGRVTKDL